MTVIDIRPNQTARKRQFHAVCENIANLDMLCYFSPVKGQPYPSMADLDRWTADDRMWVLLYLDDADGNTPKGACIEHRSGFPLFTTAFGPAYAKYAEETIGWICDNTASGTAHGPLPQDDPLRSIFLSLPGLTYELDRGTIKYRRA